MGFLCSFLMPGLESLTYNSNVMEKGGGGGLERPTESIQSRERKHCLKITPTLILELSVKIRVFCICVGDSIPLKDKAVPVNSNKLFYLCCALYLFR